MHMCGGACMCRAYSCMCGPCVCGMYVCVISVQRWQLLVIHNMVSYWMASVK